MLSPMAVENPILYPLTFRPVYKDYVWGGDRIARRYGRTAAPARCAESWELADRPEEMSVVDRGALAGRSLHELIQAHGGELLGLNRSFPAFPLLVKILDVKQTFSVQVHPDEASAARVGGEPKRELWVVLEALPGSVVFSGLKPGVDEGRLRKALADGAVADLLVRRPVKAGDVVPIPGGRVHAAGEGCLLLEIQQTSDTTYRLHDWDRVGPDGRKRELHVEKALQVIRWSDAPDRPGRGTLKQVNFRHLEKRWNLFDSPVFTVNKIELSGTMRCPMDGESFHILFVETGVVRVETEDTSVQAGPGVTVLVPAALGGYVLRAGEPLCRIIQVQLPEVTTV